MRTPFQSPARNATALARCCFGGIALGLCGFAATQASADLPSGHTPVSGTYSVNTAGDLMQITLDQNNTIIDWNDFRIKNAQLDYIRTGSGWRVLNRVSGLNTSMFNNAILNAPGGR